MQLCLKKKFHFKGVILMSNFICNECGAIYIDNGAKGYETKQCKTTSELIKNLIKKNEQLHMEICALNTANSAIQNAAKFEVDAAVQQVKRMQEDLQKAMDNYTQLDLLRIKNEKLNQQTLEEVGKMLETIIETNNIEPIQTNLKKILQRIKGALCITLNK